MSRLLVIVTLSVTALGCNDSGPFKYVPVEGQVTFEDGSLIPAKGMMLQFASMDVEPRDGMYPRPATASLDNEGRFNLATSYKYGDGLVPGRHKVAIGYATDEKGNLLIPKSCTSLSSTPLVADTNELPILIKVPKP